MLKSSPPLSTNLPMLYRDIEIWKKDCLVIMPYANQSGCTYTEKNWINQRSCCTRPGVETGSRKTLPLELNDSTLSLSCLRAVAPLSMLHTAWEAVVSRLFHWEKKSRSPHQSLAYWGLQANGFLSLGTANGWNTFPWIDCYCNIAWQWHLNSDLECQ